MTMKSRIKHLGCSQFVRLLTAVVIPRADPLSLQETMRTFHHGNVRAIPSTQR